MHQLLSHFTAAFRVLSIASHIVTVFRRFIYVSSRVPRQLLPSGIPLKCPVAVDISWQRIAVCCFYLVFRMNPVAAGLPCISRNESPGRLMQFRLKGIVNKMYLFGILSRFLFFDVLLSAFYA